MTQKADRLRQNMPFTFAGLSALLLVVFAGSLCIGRYAITPEDLLALVTGRADPASMEWTVFFTIRLPRMIAALLIGAALSVSGATYQSVFRNPLVSPDILGAAAGASFGAALAIFIGLDKIWLQALAFVFGLLGVGISYVIGVRFSGRMRDNTVTLVLCGMVITAIFSALISGVKLAADPYDELPAITFWLMGGLSYVTTDDILIMLAPLVLGGVLLFLMRFRLNVLSLSDEEISALGIDAGRSRGLVILFATLLTSGSVAVGGMIAWVGLIVPHIARLITGPDCRKLLPASLLIGAIFLTIVDDIARTLLSIELPLGVLTALVGAPMFLVLLARSGRVS
ncbi:MAG: iron ABC transporter permease [Clostridiales Family XIII bacterium]|jgi:iron complex transport system permease protein|nr:iron ABC transporter permease [Clostridiales Family XIII bacterium]